MTWKTYYIAVKFKSLCINPLLPNAHKSARFAQISILKLERIIKNISYECLDYDEKSLYLSYSVS